MVYDLLLAVDDDFEMGVVGRVKAVIDTAHAAAERTAADNINFIFLLRLFCILQCSISDNSDLRSIFSIPFLASVLVLLLLLSTSYAIPGGSSKDECFM